LSKRLINRGRKIIVVENPALDFEAKHVTRSRKAVRGEQTSRNFGLFREAIGEAHKIVALKARRLNLFAHLTTRRLRRNAVPTGRKLVRSLCRGIHLR
jgi:hypothetical protein